MKIVITGITGFIGKSLEKYLQDYEIIGVTRSLKNCKDGDNAKYIVSDYSIDDLKEIFRGAGAVVNLASQKVGGETQKGVQGYFSSISLLENIILAAKDCGITNIVNVSSRCVYGTYTENGFKETDETHPINLYGVMKIWGETISEYYNRTEKMKIKNLRLSQVVGYPMKDKYMFSTFLEKAVNNEPLEILGQGEGKRDYIYLKDVCRAIKCAVMNEERSGIYNIGSGVGVSNKEVAEKMIKIFGSKSQMNIKKDSPSDTSNIVLDVEKAKQELNFFCKYTMDTMLYDIKNMMEEGV